MVEPNPESQLMILSLSLSLSLSPSLSFSLCVVCTQSCCSIPAVWEKLYSCPLTTASAVLTRRRDSQCSHPKLKCPSICPRLKRDIVKRRQTFLKGVHKFGFGVEKWDRFNDISVDNCQIIVRWWRWEMAVYGLPGKASFISASYWKRWLPSL